MTLDPTVIGTLVSLITLGLTALGGAGAWYTFKAKLTETRGRVKELEAGHEKLSDQLSAFKLVVASECVKRDDLREVEARLGKRIDDVEHAVRNSVAKAIGEVKDLIRDTLGRGGSR